MLRRYCSKASAQNSKYATPASVIEYTRRAGPPRDVSHSDSHRPSFSMFLKVRYSVMAGAPRKQRRADFATLDRKREW